MVATMANDEYNEYDGDISDIVQVPQRRELIHIGAMQLQKANIQEKMSMLAMLTSYTGVSSSPLTDYYNKDIVVLGCMIQEVEPYIDRLTSESKPGFMQVLLKIQEKKNEQHIVLRSGALQVYQLIHDIILPNFGWFDLPSPIIMRVTQGPNNTTKLLIKEA